jgi:hypothetical protein
MVMHDVIIGKVKPHIVRKVTPNPIYIPLKKG